MLIRSFTHTSTLPEGNILMHERTWSAATRLRGSAVSAGARPCPEINHYLLSAPQPAPPSENSSLCLILTRRCENTLKIIVDRQLLTHLFFLFFLFCIFQVCLTIGGTRILSERSNFFPNGLVPELVHCRCISCLTAVSLHWAQLILKTSLAKEGNTDCVKNSFPL